jgi:hypothetical protein
LDTLTHQRARRVRRAVLAGLAGLLLAGAPGAAIPAERSDVEAAYLLKFAGYVEWPPDVFPAPDSPLRIGTLGAAAVADAAERLSRSRPLRGRPVRVQRLSPGDSFAGLHLLFIGVLPLEQVDRVLRACRALPLLTVSNSPAVHARGTMIDITAVGRSLRFTVALAPVEASGLRLSALLLSAAHRVSEARP